MWSLLSPDLVQRVPNSEGRGEKEGHLGIPQARDGPERTTWSDSVWGSIQSLYGSHDGHMSHITLRFSRLFIKVQPGPTLTKYHHKENALTKAILYFGRPADFWDVGIKTRSTGSAKKLKSKTCQQFILGPWVTCLLSRGSLVVLNSGDKDSVPSVGPRIPKKQPQTHENWLASE